MTTLEDLYYGNISPHERYIKRGTRVDKLVKLICKNEEELNSTLTEKQKETFEKFKDCTSELCQLRQYLHISTRKMKYLMDHNYIPHENTGHTRMPTRFTSILTSALKQRATPSLTIVNG